MKKSNRKSLVAFVVAVMLVVSNVSTILSAQETANNIVSLTGAPGIESEAVLQIPEPETTVPEKPDVIEPEVAEEPDVIAPEVAEEPDAIDPEVPEKPGVIAPEVPEELDATEPEVPEATEAPETMDKLKINPIRENAEKDTIIGFVALDETTQNIYLKEKVPLENVVEFFPSDLQVNIKGHNELQTIAVTWQATEDYEGTQLCQYSFYPVWDAEKHGIEQGISTPTINVYLVETISSSLTKVNPLYEDVLTEADLEDINNITEDYESSSDQFVLVKERLNSSGVIYTEIEQVAQFVRAQMVNRNTVITFNYQTTESSLENIADEMMEEVLRVDGTASDEGDYLAWNYGGYTLNAGGTVLYGVYNYELTLTVKYYTTQAQETALSSKVSQILTSLDLENQSTYSKVKAIHDYICANVKYDYAHLNDESYYLQYTAYAALFNGTAVCQGYSNLFYYMCHEEGIPVRIISGIGNGGPHGWNIVKVGNWYYNIDTTWDAASSPEISYTYFLKCESEFSNHTRNAEYSTSEFEATYPMSTKSYGQVYHVFFDANGGQVLTSQKEVVSDEAYGELPVPTCLEYRFVGWFTAIEGGQQIQATDVVAIESDQTLYARWESIPDTEYQGVDYSAVYDKAYYMEKNPGLIGAIGTDSQALLAHFVNYGMAEGRQGIATFSVQAYKKNYPGLVDVFGSDLKAYYLHYMHSGKAEGRSGVELQVEVESETIYEGVDYSAVYDKNYYMEKYPGLAEAIGNGNQTLLGHFVKCGMAEGRQGIATFSVQAYKKNYPGLVDAFGSDLKAYYLHYIYAGKAEGRSGVKQQIDIGSETVYEGIDYSAVYNKAYYIATYPGLVEVFGNDNQALLGHFVKCGMVEGRQGIATFSVQAYKKNYPGLIGVFGEDLRSYYLHYMYAGKAEGRVAV